MPGTFTVIRLYALLLTALLLAGCTAPPVAVPPGPAGIGISRFDSSVTGSVATFRWQIINRSQRDISCRLDPGDGSAARQVPCLPGTAEHAYPDVPGTYQASLTVSAPGTESATGVRTVNISPVPQLPPPGPPRGFADEMLAAVNWYRSGARMCGSDSLHPVAPLRWDSRLADAAQGHSTFMAETGKFSHEGRNGSTPPARMIAAGYNPAAAAENIAAGSPSTVDQVVAGWMNSPGHCRNIMNGNFRDLGAAVATAPNGTMYWTQNFGTERQ